MEEGHHIRCTGELLLWMEMWLILSARMVKHVPTTHLHTNGASSLSAHNKSSSLVVIRGLLTVIGGNKSGPENKLFS